MSWLRIDDGFTSNAKIVQLSDAQLRVWLKVLCYCARVGDPTVDRLVQREIPGLTPLRIRTYFSLGLLDSSAQDPDRVFEVHDWQKYLPKDATSAERQARWRARNAVTSTVTPPVTGSVTPGVTDNGAEPSRDPRAPALAGARGPSPSPTPEDQEQEQNPTPTTEARPAAGRERLAEDIDLQTLDPAAELAAARAEADDDIPF